MCTGYPNKIEAAHGWESSPSDTVRAQKVRAQTFILEGCISIIGKKDERGEVLPFFFVTSYIDFVQIFRI